MGEPAGVAIHVFAHLYRPQRQRRVPVVGRGDEHRVHFFVHLIEHFAKIPILPGLGKLGGTFGGVPAIDITQGDNALAGHSLEVAASLVAEPNGGDVQFVVRRLGPAQAKHRTGHDRQGGDASRGLGQEAAAGDLGVIGFHRLMHFVHRCSIAGHYPLVMDVFQQRFCGRFISAGAGSESSCNCRSRREEAHLLRRADIRACQ